MGYAIKLSNGENEGYEKHVTEGSASQAPYKSPDRRTNGELPKQTMSDFPFLKARSG